MSTVAELLIKLGMDDGGLDKGMASSQSKLKSWGENLRSVGTKLTAGVTLPLVGAGIAAINWASDVDQAIGKSEAVFGDQSKSVEEWSKTTANAYGFAQSESLAMASTYGSLFKVIGQTNEVAADQSMTLVGLAADMSAFNDVSNARASEALMAGLTGEYTSLKSMGIFLNEATINQEALTIAQADGRSEITEADKVQARYNTILKQTAQQQGQAARESKNFASQIQHVRAKVKDMGAAMGKMLMPYVLTFLENIQKLIDKFMDLDPKWQKIILAVAAFAAALGPVLIALGFMLPAFGALATVIGILLSPIGLLVIAIAALIGLGIYAWVNDLWGMRDAVNAVVDALSVFEPMLGDLMDAFQALKEGDFAEVWDELKEAAVSALQGIGDLAGMAMDALRNMDWAGIFQGGLDILNSVVDAIRGVDWGSLIQGGWDVLYSGLQLAWDAVKDIPWTDIIGKLEDFGTWLAGKVSDVDWVELIGEIVDFYLFLGEKIPRVDWGAIIGKIEDFAVFLGGKIAEVDWIALIGQIADFAVWLAAKVPSVTWSDFVPDISWSDCIPKLSWPSKDEILDALLGRGDEQTAPYNDPRRYEPTKSQPGSNEGAGYPFVGGEMVTTLPAVGSGPQSLFDKISGIAQQITSTITQLATSVQSNLQQITNTFTTTAQQVGSTLQQLQSRVQQTFQQIQQQATQATNQLRTAVTSAWTQLAQQVQQQAQSMQQRVQQAFQQAQQQATQATNQLRTSVTNAMNQMVSSAGTSMSQFVSRVRSGFQDAQQTARNGVNQIRSAVTGMDLSGPGANLVQGLIDGMGSRVDALQAVANTISGILASIDKSGSPWPMFVESGAQLVRGLEVGMGSRMPSLEAAANGVSDTLAGIGGNGWGSDTGNWGGSQTVVNNYYAVSAKDLQQLLEDSDTGASFARSFGAQLGLYTGQP